MNLEETLARKRENLMELIAREDKAIQKEIRKYEYGELYIRLQSECFNLYPIVIKALSLLIVDDKRRAIFCSVVKGHKLKSLGAFYNLTPEEVGREFRSTVWELRQCINNGAFTEKESVNIRLLRERNDLKHRLQNCKTLCEKLQFTNKDLNELLENYIDQKMSYTPIAVVEMQKSNQAVREEIRKELQEEMKREMMLKSDEGKLSKVLNRLFIVMPWIKRLKLTK